MVEGRVKKGEEALERFRRFCREKGGRIKHGIIEFGTLAYGTEIEVVPDVTYEICVLDATHPWAISDHLRDFHKLVQELKNLLPKPIELVVETRRIGGLTEAASVFYDPKEDEYSVYARLYGEGKEPVEYVKDEVVRDEEKVRIKVERKWPERRFVEVTIRGKGTVDYNYVTEKYVGCGEAFSNIKGSDVRAWRDLGELLKQVFHMADEMREEAEEELIIIGSL